MKVRFRSIMAGLLTLFLAGACTTQTKELTLEEKLAGRGFILGPQVSQIRNYTINGWNSLDRKNVIMNVGVSRYYLVTVRSPCEGLTQSERLAFSTTVGNLTDKDKLIVRQGPGWVDHCFIDTIFELEKRGDKE